MAHYFLLSDANLTFCEQRDDGAWHTGPTFTPDESGQSGLRHFLASKRSLSPRLLLLDGEATYHLEKLPPLQGHSRKKMLAERQRKCFPDASLIASIRLPGKSREHQSWLFSAISPSTTLTIWLQILNELGRPAAALHDVSQLAAPLLQQCGKTAPALLLSIDETGLREDFVIHGYTCFSRRLSLARSRSLTLIDELSALRQHLIRQHLLAQHTALTVYVLAAPAQQPRMDEAALHAEKIICQALDMPAPFPPLPFGPWLPDTPHPLPSHDGPGIRPQQFLSRFRQILAEQATPICFALASLLSAYTLAAQLTLKNSSPPPPSAPATRVAYKPSHAPLTSDNRHEALRRDMQRLSQLLVSYPSLQLEKLEWTFSDADHTFRISHATVSSEVQQAFLQALKRAQPNATLEPGTNHCTISIQRSATAEEKW